jgi:hypothetical protein
MTITAGAGDIAQGYEALRAQALGAPPMATPRGRAVLLGAGMTAWMSALPPSARPRPAVRCATRASQQNSQGGDLVRLLAEMVMASQGRCRR